MCSSIIPHTSTISNSFTPKELSTSKVFYLFFSRHYFSLSPPNCVWPRCLTYYIWWTGGTEWTCKQITVRQVEQQQCTDYRQDLCEEHMISSLIPLSDWPWWRGSCGWDQRGGGLDSLGQSQTRTDDDDSGSQFNRKSSPSHMRQLPAKSILSYITVFS